MNITADTRCPCGTGETYGSCCGRLHAAFDADGSLTAPTPEALMRSRFTAFAVGNEAYLLATWAPQTRPESLGLDENLRWYRLDVLGSTGGPFDAAGTVEFAAHYRSVPGTPEGQRVKGVQRENSRFVRTGGAWYYLDGNVG